jgi:transcription antitermination factor NusG
LPLANRTAIITVPNTDLRRHFVIGDLVKFVDGPYIGQEAFILNVRNGNFGSVMLCNDSQVNTLFQYNNSH